MKNIQVAALLITGMLLVSCTRQVPTLSCEDMTFTALKPALIKPTSADELATQVRDTLQLPSGAVGVATVDPTSATALPPMWATLVAEGGASLTWRQDGNTYNIQLSGMGNVEEVRIVLSAQSRLSIDQAIKCLGRPVKYWGYVYTPAGRSPQHREASLVIFYSETGYSVIASSSGSDEHPPAFDREAHVSQIRYIPPDGNPDVVTEFIDKWGSAGFPAISEQIRPWPDRWEDLIIFASP